jgi:4-hydroxy-2-oxoheptanedioate aldolase
MRRNTLRTLHAAGAPIVNAWLGIPSAYSAEIIAHQGWDSATIDMQHGMIDYQICALMLQAISTSNAVPLVRVPWNDPAQIMKVLDAGAYGVICPMINNAAEAKAFVDACRYPPRGYRSYGPNRVMLYAGTDYPALANDEILTLVMIETADGLANLDSILEVPGVDGVYVGPADLSLALGVPASGDPKDPKVLDAIGTILSHVRAKRLLPGIHTVSAAMARRMLDAGYGLVTVMSDTRFLAAGGENALAELRGSAAASPGPSRPY